MPPFDTAAQIPNPRLAALQPFIGEWTTAGSHSMMPGVALHGRTAFEWHEGGGFVCMRTEIDEPQIPSAIAIIGSNDATDTISMLYFDERTVSRQFEVKVQGDMVCWERAASAPDFSQRYTLTRAADGRTMRGVSEMAKDGAAWEQDMELEYRRVE